MLYLEENPYTSSLQVALYYINHSTNFRTLKKSKSGFLSFLNSGVSGRLVDDFDSHTEFYEL